MEQLLESVENSLRSKNWLSALFVAVTLPDICAASEGLIAGVGDRYRDWFNRYLKKKYDSVNQYEYYLSNDPERAKLFSPSQVAEYSSLQLLVKFTAQDCWVLRNATLHQGMDEKGLRKFRLTVPDENNNIHHMTYDNARTMVQLDATILCKDIIEAVRCWHQDMSNNPAVLAKISNMIRIRDHNMIFS